METVRRWSVEQVLDNPLQTGEAGKAVGLRAATGEVVAFIDSDNFLVGSDWLRRMVAPFRDPRVVSSEPLRWAYGRDQSYVDRYCALTGVNDPASLFVGNYGRYSHLTRKWTGFPVEVEQAAGYLRVRVDPDLLPTMGANGYLVRVAPMLSVVTGEYLFDIDAVGELARAGFDVVARVDTEIGHAFAAGYGDFVRKTQRRARDYLYYSALGRRTYPWVRYRFGLARFAIATILVIPPLVQAAIGYSRRADRAWWFHPVACWTTLVVYVFETLRAPLRRERLSRHRWRQ